MLGFGAALIAATLLAAGAAFAQHDPKQGHGMPDHDMAGHAQARQASSPVIAAFGAANARMHKDMDVKLTGDADSDFVKSMIPHHQGAIDMAKVELAYGKDPAIRKLAEDVIEAQEAEIARMRQWLKDRGQ